MVHPNDNARLVHASLARMGTMSMAEAYRILGYRPHHYHQLKNPDEHTDWEAFERAVDGKWPQLDGANPGRRAFTREDWEAQLGDKFDFFTDFYAHFTLDHIRAYPEAKVVIVEREFEKWWPSYWQICIEFLLRPTTRLIGFLMRSSGQTDRLGALERQYEGFFHVSDIRLIDEDKARKIHEEFFKEVRRSVPRERRLDYQLGQGWEPLCKFLNKPVPDVPFPRLNERAELLKKYDNIALGVIAASGSVVAAIAGLIWYVLLR